MLILHMPFEFAIDDIHFQNELANNGYFELLKLRYFTWTSRFIIESILFLIVSCPIIAFKILNVIVVLFLAASLTRLISSDMDKRKSWIVVLLFLMYPFNEMSSAGWAATSLNYLWPAAAGAFSLIPFVKCIRGERIRGYEYPLYVAALLFAANQEQVAALILGFGVVFTAFIAIRDKSTNKFLIFLNAIALGSLLFILTCPGNSVRLVAEVERWFPGYASLSVKFRLFLGIGNIVNYLFNKAYIFIFILSFILLLIIIKKKVGKIATVLASGTVIFCFLANLTWFNLRATLFPAFDKFLSHVDLRENPYSGMVSFIPILVCCAVVGLLFIEIYLVYGKSNRTGLLLLILCAGLAASVIIGFSPTVYASGYRIFIFLNLTFIVVIALIVKFEWNNFSHREKQLFYAILIACGAYNYFDSYIIVLNQIS